jgi:DNA-binding CsgD family transcriptional regulator
LTADRNDQSPEDVLAAQGDSAAAMFPGPSKESVAEAVEHFSRRARATDRSPRILIDGDCHVLWQSPDAERLLQPPLPLWIKGGRIHVPNGPGRGSGAKTWPSFLDHVGEEGERLLLTGKSASTWVLLRGWAERFGDHRLIFLKCAMSWPFRDVASSGLAKDFGLTRSECAVLDEFARLAKPNQIAERLNISVSTVRSHLKQIHTKMSVNSNVHLLRVTRAYTDT